MTLIPAERLGYWASGSQTGVTGGFEQYLDSSNPAWSGGSNNRNTSNFTVVSADRTGVTNATSAIISAFNSASANTGAYLPAGVYYCSSTITFTQGITPPQNKTFRGDGSYAHSTTSNLLAVTGTKTFTVPENMPWEAGIGCRVWKRHDPRQWMQGVVSSYSGSTLQIAINNWNNLGVGSVTVTNGGSYSQAPNVVFSGGGGAGAYAVANIGGGVLTSITVLDPGHGYTSAPTVSFTGGVGSGGVATATLDTSPITDWAVSLTFIDSGTSPSILIGTISTGNDYNAFGGGNAAVTEQGLGIPITTQANRGATSIVVSDASSFAAGSLVNIYKKNTADEQTLLDGKAFVFPFLGSGCQGSDYLRAQLNRVSSSYSGGTTIPLDNQLLFDLELSLDPVVVASPYVANKVGIEGITFKSRGGQTVFGMEMAANCWAYDVQADFPANYGFNLQGVWRSTFSRCASYGRNANVGVSNGAGILGNGIADNLIENTILYGNFPGIELNSRSSGNAWVDVFASDPFGFGSTCSNHGPHNSFNLWEHMITPYWQSDGYFGTQSEDTISRCWFHGDGTILNVANIVHNRGSHVNNMVGNVIGRIGVRNGSISYGNPNRGNSFNSGTRISPHGDGSFWLQYDGTSSTLTCTVLSQTAKTLTMSPLTGAALQHPHIYTGAVGSVLPCFWYTWDSCIATSKTITSIVGNVVTLDGGRSNFSISSITRSGALATVTTSADHGLQRYNGVWINGADQSEYNGGFSVYSVPSSTTFTVVVSGSPATPATGTIVANDFPPNGTTMMFSGGIAGYQDLDGQTEDTAIDKGNFSVVGSSGTFSSLGGDTVPASYVYSSRPWWWHTSLSYPAINSAAPEELAYDITPAGYRFVNGVDAGGVVPPAPTIPILRSGRAKRFAKRPPA